MNKLELIKQLRELTQAGMQSCKEALEACEYDMNKAVDYVKAKGLNIVSGREGKAASEGAVFIAQDNAERVKSLTEINSQTDFVSRNDLFLEFGKNVAQTVLIAFQNNKPFSTADVEEKRQELVSVLKENIIVRRWWVEEAINKTAKVFHYIHPNNKIGVLLTLLSDSESGFNSPEFETLGNDLAMQVAAMNPLSVSPDTLDPTLVARQEEIFKTQLKELKKPEASWPNILKGKANKWNSEVCLLNQESIIASKTSVSQVIDIVAKKLSCNITVLNFIRVVAGEGLDKPKETNLAQEVEKMIGA